MNKKLLKKKRKKLREQLDKKIVGFHVYRSENENLPFAFWARLTDDPVPEGEFEDPAAARGGRFFYKLTKVYEDGTESRPITPQSKFTDHAGNDFAQNPLKDFAGYNIYRSADEKKPLDQWEKRNREPLPTNEFRDEGVSSGEVYFYFVRAVASDGTESAPGEIVRVIRK